MLEFLLMCDEFELTSPVKGTSDFAAEFELRGIQDANGRSLRDFDLETRMFRYPCSYMIHSDAFNGLPNEVRLRVFSKLKDILAGDVPAEDAEKFAHLSHEDCSNIQQILAATIPEFAAVCEGGAK